MWLRKAVLIFTAVMLVSFALGFVCMVLAWIPPVRRLLAWTCVAAAPKRQTSPPG